MRPSPLSTFCLLLAAASLAACAAKPPPPPPSVRLPETPAPVDTDPHDLALLNRITWGGNTASAQTLARIGAARLLSTQLAPPGDDALPPVVRDEIAGLPLAHESLDAIAATLRAERQAIKDAKQPDADIAAKQAFQKTLEDLSRQAATRTLLRDLYSQNQLKEQLTWFWMNHFNVSETKGDIRAFVGDYEDRAIRPHALGRFRDLLAATVRHPAMLLYLDNAQNSAGHINENYAREIMELHTLGVSGGYTQKDVQELARILTGLGVNQSGKDAGVPKPLRSQYVRAGLFEFNPKRHDYGDKVFLGHAIKGSGLAEVDQALDLLSRAPATARLISRKLAVYFVSDNPSDALVTEMAATFQRSDGNVAEVLRTLFASPEFAASLGTRFKDPMHFVVSAVRATYGNDAVVNTQPLEAWLGRLGEPLYRHETPDGYPLVEAPWSARATWRRGSRSRASIGSGHAGLFKPKDAAGSSRPAFHRSRRHLTSPQSASRSIRRRAPPCPREVAPGLQFPVPVFAQFMPARRTDETPRPAEGRSPLAAPRPVAGRAWAAPAVTDSGCSSCSCAAPMTRPMWSSRYPATSTTSPGRRLRSPGPIPAWRDAALPLDADWGLHPALKDSLYPLWQKKQIAFVPFAGTDDLSRSHFETQDTIELGQPLAGHAQLQLRLHEPAGRRAAGARPIAFTDQLPLIFRGGASIPNVGSPVGKPGIDDRQAKADPGMYSGRDPLAPRSAKASRCATRSTARSRRDGGGQPRRGVAEGLRAVGAAHRPADARPVQPRLRRCRRLGHPCRPGRGDRLSRRPPGRAGPGAGRLRRGDRARSLERHGRRGDLRVRPYLPRERRPGHRPWPWQRLLGYGRRRERRPHRRRPGRGTPATLFQNRDFPVLTEYRAMLAGLFRRIYGLSPAQLQTVFPQTAPKDIALV